MCDNNALLHFHTGSTLMAVSIHWFRKGLRVHDNPALLASLAAEHVAPVFCIDPTFANTEVVGVNRYR